VIQPNGGTFFRGKLSVQITCATPNAMIYYTTDGTTPTASSILYTGYFVISSATTIEAIAFADGYTPSAIATASFKKK
jgi:sialidase-1